MTTKQPDWEAIERAYRAGLLSIREIASTQGITHGAINKRAKRDGCQLGARLRPQAGSFRCRDQRHRHPVSQPRRGA